MRRINPSRLRLRLQFGHVESKETINGVNTDKQFVCDVEVWGGIYTNSMTQTYVLMGQGVTDTKSFIVRHNSELQKYTHLKYQDNIYTDLVFNEDPYDAHDSFDTVTGKLVTKRGR